MPEERSLGPWEGPMGGQGAMGAWGPMGAQSPGGARNQSRDS